MNSATQTETMHPGQSVTIQCEQLGSFYNGSTGVVSLVCFEPNAYTGDRIAIYHVLVNGRMVRVQDHEIAPAA